jgi:hypothetical protein
MAQDTRIGSLSQRERGWGMFQMGTDMSGAESIIDSLSQVDAWLKTPGLAPSPSGRGLG